MFAKLERVLLFLLILLLPSQLALHLWPSWSFVNGIPVDYLSPTLYFTDLLILSLFILVRSKISVKIPLPVLIFVVLNLLFSISPLVTLLSWLRVLELYWLFLYLRQLSDFRSIALPLSLAFIWTSLLAWFQFYGQTSLGGLWSLLGERPLSPVLVGVAKINLCPISLDSCTLLLRPYATLPHPNALAGFLLVSVLILFHLTQKYALHRGVVIASTILALITIPLTFSRSAIILECLVLLLYLIRRLPHNHISKVILPAFVFLSSLWVISIGNPASLAERLALANKSWHAISSSPLIGTGLGTFPVLSYPLPFFSHNLNFQPVHNIYLLLASELGLLVALLVCSLIGKKLYILWRGRSWTLIIPYVVVLATGLVDHYWLTLHQNQMLLLVLLTLVYNEPNHHGNQS